MALDINKYDAADVLQFLLSSGTICMNDVAADMKKAERKEILSKHPYPITQGSDGRWRTYVKQDGQQRKQIAKSTYEKVEDAVIDFYISQKDVMANAGITLELLYPRWLEYKTLHAAAPTYLKRIESNWRTYYEGTEIVRKPITALNKLILDVWAHELIQKVGNVKKEYYNISMLMRQMLDYAVDADLIPENPFRKVKIDARRVFNPVKKQANELQVFTKTEVEELYEAAWRYFRDGRNTIHKLTPLAIMFQFQTGLRVGELLALRYEDITGNELYVQRMYRYEVKEIVEYTKGHNEGRYVVLTAEALSLVDAAKRYQCENGLCSTGFIFSVNKDPLPYGPVKKMYTVLCDEIDTTHKSSHKSRKTYISALIDGGVNINTIRDLVGHADEHTTLKSYCYDRKEKPERVKLIEKALSQ